MKFEELIFSLFRAKAPQVEAKPLVAVGVREQSDGVKRSETPSLNSLLF